MFQRELSRFSFAEFPVRGPIGQMWEKHLISELPALETDNEAPSDIFFPQGPVI